MMMRNRLAACLIVAGVVTGCKEKSSADLAKDTLEARGDIAEQQKDVRKAEEQLDKSQKEYQKQTEELERAQKRANDARSDLAKRAREDSAATRAPR